MCREVGVLRLGFQSKGVAGAEEVLGKCMWCRMAFLYLVPPPFVVLNGGDLGCFNWMAFLIHYRSIQCWVRCASELWLCL